MQSLLFSMNHYFEKLPAFLRRWRWPVMLALFSFTVFVGAGLVTRLQIDMSQDIWFKDDAPALKNRAQFRAQFGSDESVFIVYRPESGDVFSASALRTLAQLHQDIEQTSYRATAMSDGARNLLSRIERVDSLFNARYQIADGDTLIARKLIGAEYPRTDAAREERRAIAASQESFRHVFFSDDFRYGVLQLKTDFGAVPLDTTASSVVMPDEGALLDDSLTLGTLSSDPFAVNLEVTPLAADQSDETPVFAEDTVDEYDRFMKALKALTDKPAYSNFEFYFAGNPVMMESQLAAVMEASSALLIMLVMIMVVLRVLLRSFSAVVWSMLGIVLSLCWAMGFGAWLGASYSTMLVLTTMLAIAVGIASIVHVLSAYLFFRRAGEDHVQAIASAYRKTGFAILLTVVTTMVGMLSLTLADMPAVSSFGFVSALVVAFIFVYIAFLLPLLLDLWHPESAPAAKTSRPLFRSKLPSLQPFLRAVANFCQCHARKIVVSYVVIFVALLVGAVQVKTNSNFVDLYKDGHPVRVTTQLVDEKLMGALSLEVYLDFNQADALKDPQVLKQIDQFQQHLKAAYSDKLIKSLSLADVVKDTHRVMNEGKATFHSIPDDPRLTAQLLYLFNNANASDRRSLVSDDYSRSHITLFLRNGGSHEYIEMFESLQGDISTYFDPLISSYPAMEPKLTGVFHLMMELIRHIAVTQLKSFGAALLIITALMMVTLGSKQAGVISILPNLIPAVFTFGVMGYLNIPLNTDMLIIAPIIIGIAVDDTIHFLTHYRNAWYEYGDVDKAIRSTLSEVGQAVILTTAVLAIGFGVLGFSDYLGLAKPGIAGAVAIVVALLSDLLFLPALIYWVKPELGRKQALEKMPVGAV